MGIVSVSAQSLYVYKNSNSSAEYTLDKTTKLSFNNGKIVIAQDSKTATETSLSEISKIMFEDAGGSSSIKEEEKSSSTNKLQCYPNPADNFLNVEMEDNEGDIKVAILTTAGRTVLTEA